MHKNVKVLIIFLSILVVLGYVIWLKNKLFPIQYPPAVLPTPTLETSITEEPTQIVTPFLNPATSSASSTSSAVYNSSPSAKINY